MDGWNIIVENLIREAIEQGKFDNLRGSGQPLELDRNPFEDPLAPAFRRILRDNGATHPQIEARRALEEEIATLRRNLERAWDGFLRHGSRAAWQRAMDAFRERATDLNRHIKLNNLRAPIPNFHVRTLEVEAEIAACCGGRRE